MKTNNSSIVKALALSVVIAFTSCKKKEEAEKKSTEKTSGYVVHTTVKVGNTSSSFLTHHDKMPSGKIDNSKGKSFQRFRGRMMHRNYFLAYNVNGGESDLSKIMFDAKGVAFEKSKLLTLANVYYGAIKDDKTAYTYDWNDKYNKLTVFDPSTMKAKGKIDLSKSFKDKDWLTSNFEGFVIRGSELFVSSRPINAKRNLVADTLVYHVIDLTTNKFKKSIFFPKSVAARRETENWIDEQGNIYIATTGNSILPHVKPNIMKIPAGQTDFDKNYDFRVVDKIPQGKSLPVQFLTSFTYYKNGKAYANASTSFPLELLEMVKKKPSFGQWTRADYQKALTILRTAANGQYIEIDLNSQTVKVLSDIPPISPLNGFIRVIDDKVYAVSSNTEENAVYEYDPATGKSKKVFDVTGGGAIRGFFKLEK